MHQKKILIVEDEVVFGIDLIEKLKNLGYRPDPKVVRHGEKVLEAAQKSKPDLILMGVKLKGKMSGVQAAMLVQDHFNTPVIFTTAFSDVETMETAKKSEAYAFLEKPVKHEDLQVAIKISLYKAEMEQQLKENEILFRTVADFSYDWETLVGPDGDYQYISPSCERISGYTHEQFINDPQLLFNIVHTEDKEHYQSNIETHFNSSKDIHSFEFRIISADRNKKWIEYTCRPVFDQDGQYIGRRENYRDISDRKKTETALKKSVVELQGALDSLRFLKGFIRTCAHCRKIRDDKGHWDNLENYIAKHTEAVFSHGICPTCLEENYGGKIGISKSKKQSKQKKKSKE